MSFLDHYDFRIAVLAVAIGLANGLVNRSFISRLAEESSARRRLAMSLFGLLSGVTVWAVMTLTVLGFHWIDPTDGAPLDVGYDPLRVIASLGFAAGVLSASFRLNTGRRASVWRPLVAGGSLGFVAAAVNVMTLRALHVQGEVTFDLWLLGLNFTLSTAGTAFARLFNAGPTRFRRPRVGQALLAVTVLCVVGLSIASVSLAPDRAMTLPPGIMPPAPVGFFVAAVAVIVTAASYGVGMVGASMRQEADSRYRHLALHDPLTGLPNRAHLMTALADALADVRAEGSPGVAVVGVDLDRFKPVNDVHGHAAGDALLRGIGAAAKALLEPGEIFARTGGDEFIALKLGADEDAALEFARRLRRATCAPVAFDGSELMVGASFGIALCPRDGLDAETLLGRMDLALYRAKEEPADAMRLYDRRMDEARRDRSALAMELRAGLEHQEFDLYFQPQTRLSDGAVTGYEALIRWRHPIRGLILPDDFIPVAERTGLIREIGAWVLYAACREAATWREDLRIAVNISPRQVAQNDFTELVADALLVTGLAPDRLELEITEASMIEDHAQLRAVMAALKALGVRVAMDDYGAGYASLAALRKFPFDKIKIDREFIETLGVDPQSAAIVRSTLMLGRALGIPVLAEGVTTEAGRRILQEEGCLEAQGFLFGHPMPASELPERDLRAPRDGGAGFSESSHRGLNRDPTKPVRNRA